MKTYLKIIYILKKFQPYSIYFLFFLFFFSGFLEALGISLVIPIIALIINNNFLTILANSSYAFYVPNFILDLNYNDAFLFFSIFLIFVYFLKNLILIFSEYYKNIFLGKVKSTLSLKLINNYLHQDYLYHSKKNSYEFNSIINQKINDLTEGLLSSVLIIFSEMLIIIFLFFLIMFANQEKISLILIILFSFGFILAKKINKIIKKLGSSRNKHINSKFRNFNIIVNSFREFLLIGKTGDYFQNYQNSLFSIIKLDAIRSAFQRSPQLILELIGIISLIVIIYYLKHLNFTSEKIIAICGFFAATSYRAIPSLNKIFFFHYNIKFYKETLDEISEELKIEKRLKYHSEKFEEINSIQLKNVSLKYHDKNNLILENIDLQIESNSTVGIYGESGIGKTTFLDILSCLIQPNDGFLYINKIKIDNHYLIRKYQNNISYTSQKTIILNDTFQKNICFYENTNNIDLLKLKQCIMIARLNELEENLKKSQHILDDSGKNLSGGQIQRIGIARALYQDKDILIFDESTNALDEELEKNIISNIIKMKRNKIIIFVSHNLNILENMDHIYEIKNKKLTKVK